MGRHNDHVREYMQNSYPKKRQGNSLLITALVLSILVNIVLVYALNEAIEELDDQKVAIALLESSLDYKTKLATQVPKTQEPVTEQQTANNREQAKQKQEDCYVREGNSFRNCD